MNAHSNVKWYHDCSKRDFLKLLQLDISKSKPLISLLLQQKSFVTSKHNQVWNIKQHLGTIEMNLMQVTATTQIAYVSYNFLCMVLQKY